VTPILISAALVAIAYFIGSIPVGVLVARSKGTDIQTVGSGNIGATNVARTLGKRAGALVLVLDAIKGAGPAGAALWLTGRGTVDPFVVTAVGFAAIAGHCFPVWLGFRGGKGVATSLGVFLVLAPLVTAIVSGVWLAVYLAFHIVSLGSMVAASSYVPLLIVFDRGDELVALAIATALLILIKHRGNMLRLVRRQESHV